MWWRKYFSRQQRSEELRHEIEFHIAHETEENLARGMRRGDAERAARLRFGRATGVREVVYEMNTIHLLEALWKDIRYGLRQMRLNAGFTATAVLSLALGIGANTAIFTLVDQVVLRLLPVKNPRELVQLRIDGDRFGSNTGDGEHTFSYPLFRALQDQNTVFTGVTGQVLQTSSVIGEATNEMVRFGVVAGNFFQVFGVEPFMGRLLTPEDDTARNAHPVVILQYSFWQQRYASDPNIVGKTMRITGVPFEIIGVAAPGFEGTTVGSPTNAWLPITMRPAITQNWDELDNERSSWFYLFARLKPGLSLEQAQAAMRVLYGQRQQEELKGEFFQKFPEERQHFLQQTFGLEPASGGQYHLREDVAKPLVLLQWLVAVVLLIACTNVANLLLARATARQREVAIRGAIGASRSQLIRQFLVESSLIAAAGGIAGVLLSSWMTRGLLYLMPFDPANSSLSTTPDARVLLFSAAITLLTAILFGLAPALRGSNVHPGATLKESAGAVSGAQGHVRLRKTFVALQVGLSCMLMIGAGLFARTLENLSNVQLGFNTENVVKFALRPAVNYDDARRLQVFRSVLEELKTVPKVKAVGANRVMLLTGGQWDSGITMPGVPATNGNPPSSFMNAITPGYFEALGIAVTAGRDLSWNDWGTARKLCLVNQEFVDEYLAGASPVGRMLGLGREQTPDREIIGVVSNTRYEDVRGEIPRQTFIALDSHITRTFEINVFAKVQGDPRPIMPLIREKVHGIDANMLLSQMSTLDEQLNTRMSNERLLSFLSAGFAVLASLLAIVGLHGVLTFVVMRRTKEIGIRMALGAPKGSVIRLVMAEMVLVIGIGTAAGIVAALLCGRFVQAQLFGVNAGDLVVFAVSAAALPSAALLAAFAPAWRASRIDPMTALRHD